MNKQERMKRWLYWWLYCWTTTLDGLVGVLSLGFFNPNLSWKIGKMWIEADTRMEKRQEGDDAAD